MTTDVLCLCNFRRYIYIQHQYELMSFAHLLHLLDPRQRCRQGVFCGPASDPERSALPTPPYSDDVDSLTRHHQGRLLQLFVGWCFQSATQQVAVHIQRCCTDDLLVQEVGAHHSTAV